MKVLTCIRVGNKQKKIDISVPKLDSFIHKVYINAARKIYSNVYLFERNVSPLLTQKNNRELEVIIQECILLAIRESIPTEAIIRAYMDESMEQEEEIIIENIPEEPVAKLADEKSTNETDPIRSEEDIPSVVPSVQNINDDQVVTRLTFNDLDSMMDDDNNVQSVNAPKSIERLEQISTSRAIQRKLEEESDDEDDERLKISTETIDLSGFDLLDDKTGISTDDFMLDGVEELP